MYDLRSEAEIMANWKGDISKPVVSICCITYNHEPYIEDALKGFLIQETDFPFEIIIHDDASQDATKRIIQSYQKAYPRLIKTIIQEENIFSKEINALLHYVFPAAKGAYIAYCEGDDYWFSKNCLTQKIEYLRKNHNVSFVFTPARIVDKNKKNLGLRNKYNEEQIGRITFEWVLSNGGGFYPTSTIMFRKSSLYHEHSWILNYSVGDHAMALNLALVGNSGYLPEPTAAYRVHSNSLTRTRDEKWIIGHYDKCIELLTRLNNHKLINLKLFHYLQYKERYMCAIRIANSESFKSSIKFILNNRVSLKFFSRYLVKMSLIYIKKSIIQIYKVLKKFRPF